jgi:hypothetical protein
MRKIRCPKCGKAPTQYIEYWAGFCISFDVTPEGLPEEEGWMTNDGNPYRVSAKCQCGHIWNLRGVLQITDLRNKQ